MGFKATIKENYTAAYEDPLVICSGDTVSVSDEYHGNPEWKNWVWCSHQQTHKKGWVPKQYLEISGRHALALNDFNARELTVSIGDQVRKISSINGWALVQRNQECGWIPEACISG